MSAFSIRLHTLGGTQNYEAANFTQNQLAAILYILANAGRDPVPPAERERAAPILLASEERSQVQLPGVTDLQHARVVAAKKARLSGYTGDMCTTCGSDKMRRNGSCLLCEGCGSTTGCS